MKKIILIFTAFLLCFTTSVCSFANGAKYETMFDLFQSWDENYPDYVCGIWSNDGTDNDLTVALIEGEEGEKGKAEILSLIRNHSTVTFTTMKYSRNHLISIQESLYEYFDKGIGLMVIGVYETQNKVVLEIQDDYVSNTETKLFVKYVEETYGDAVKVNFSNIRILPTIESNPYTETLTILETKGNDNTPLYVSAAALLLLTVFAVTFFYGKKKSLVMSTTNGHTIEESKVTNKEVIESVKNSSLTPSESLESRILDDINEIK